MTSFNADIIIVGAGAAGLATAIFALERAHQREQTIRLVLLDGAKKPGAKILISGGGRCNVTHKTVTAANFNGGMPTVIRNVLRGFDETRTADWMRGLGVALKEEDTGKLFPVSDQARTVLDALLSRVKELDGQLIAGTRVADITPTETGWSLRCNTNGQESTWTCRRLVVATGGLALPKSGSDGAGLQWMRNLGHTVVPTSPALVPLTLKADCPDASILNKHFADFTGLAIPATLTWRDAQKQPVASATGPVLFTHFGLSGPAVLDISRHVVRWQTSNPGGHGHLTMALHPSEGAPAFASVADADTWLQQQINKNSKRGAYSIIAPLCTDRIARVLTDGLPPHSGSLNRTQRQALAQNIAAAAFCVSGHRGYAFAETTAGGVDLGEINSKTMESRKAPGLYLTGEIIDVDGHLGGFNFQWAWSTAHIAGPAAADSLV